MARLREPSIGLTPDKPGGRHTRLRGLPLVQESPSQIVDLEDSDSKEQDKENDSSGAEGNRRTPAGEAEAQFVTEVDLVADVTKEDTENDQESGTDRGVETDLVRAGDRLARVSGRIGGVAQRLQGEPATPQDRSRQDSPSVNSAGVPEEISGSEAEAERSAARLNAVTRLGTRSRQDSSAKPAKPRRGKRTTVTEPPTGHLSRPPKATSRGTSALKMAPTSTATVPQSLSPSKRKRGTEVGPSGSPIRRVSVSREKQPSKSRTGAVQAGQSNRPRLPRLNHVFHDMTKAGPGKIHKATTTPRVDLYNPPLEEKGAAISRSTRASSANNKKLHAADGGSPIGTMTRRAARDARGQQHQEQEQQEGGQDLEAEKDEMETAEPIKEVPGKKRAYPTPAGSSTTRRTTRANPTGDRQVSQTSAHKLAIRPASSGSKARNAAQAVPQKAGPEKEVAKVASAGPRRSARMGTHASRGAHNASGGLGRRAKQETMHGHYRQSPPDHRVRKGNERSVKTVVPTQLPSSSFNQPPDTEHSSTDDVAQSGDQADDSDVEGYGHVGNNISPEERLELVMDYVYDIQRGRRAYKCETRVMEEFVGDIHMMGWLYSKLGKQEPGTSKYDGLCEELDRVLEEIEDRSHLIMSQNIRAVPRKDRTDEILKEKRETLQDLYTWAIPDLVSGIKKAVDCHTDNFIATQDLHRIMKLQDVVIKLGDPAWRRGVRPGAGTLGSLKGLRHVVLPNIKKLQQGYREELKERRQARDRRLEENLQRRVAEEERQRRERKVEIKRRRRVINDQVLSELVRTDPKYGANQHSESRHSQSQHREESNRPLTQGRLAGNKPNEWPKAELLALVQGLEKFTGNDRYAQIVQEHCGPGGVLQSRSMDELFEKAKEFKADVYGDWELHPDDGPLPDYILSI